MTEQYWADGSTKNCVWLFQVKQKEYGEDGCNCGAWNHEECRAVDGKECCCGFEFWRTENVFLLREEAREHGKARPYAWGEEKKGWRIYGVMCLGTMAELLGKHNQEFKDGVEYVSKGSFGGRVEACKNSQFNGVECLESEKQYGFFKDNNDVRPSSCTWIDKDDAGKLWRVFKK